MRVSRFVSVGFLAFVAACSGSGGSVKSKVTTSTTVEPTTTTAVEDTEWAMDALVMTEDVQMMLQRLSDALDTESMVLIKGVCEDGFVASLEWITIAETVPLSDVRTPLAQAMDEYNTMFMHCSDGDLESAIPFLRRANAHAEQATEAMGRYS